MTSCQAQICTQHLNSIQGSIFHKLWGDDVEYWGGDGANVGADEDGDVDVIEMLPPYTKEQSVTMMAVISL
jgi:hypothetical protein